MSINTARYVDSRHAELVGEFHPSAKCLKLGFPAGLRNGPANQCVGGVFFYGAGGFAACRVAHNLTTRWVRGVLRDVRCLQSLTVSPPGMSVVAFQINRPVGHDLIQIFLVQTPPGPETGILPSAPHAPRGLPTPPGVALPPAFY